MTIFGRYSSCKSVKSRPPIIPGCITIASDLTIWKCRANESARTSVTRPNIAKNEEVNNLYRVKNDAWKFIVALIEITRTKIGVRITFGLMFSLWVSAAAMVAIAVYQRTMKDLAPRGLFRKSLARRNPLRTANQGKIKAPSGKKVRAPFENAEVRANLNGIKWLPSQIQIAARIGQG